ncbi:MAG: hypothetical protein A2913_00815 [Parcubacteria group bacterium RIFCSPLOWO2_01_FULL_40_65]|nr:MAG: hypothetical protein A2734_02535 [Parcubacteria group bacterium RIFCSPHIGHO2_01_FULL_40_30]OHB21122.1 MAG: hypothetical protein A2913_00815 [Parcubacteria group bacterium RIFCSPLOWO2_01_FULL_40_65]
MTLNKILIFIILFSTFAFIQVQAQPLPGYDVPPLPSGSGLTTGGINSILILLSNFLIGVGVILAIMTIVISGIMYFRAGSDTKADAAKGWFRNGIIGAFIILAVGVIILTIYNIVVTGSFFGGSGVPGTGPGTGFSSGIMVGNSCTTDGQCSPPESFCTGGRICRRAGGNLQLEKCDLHIDCATGLTCKGGTFGLGQKTCKP